MSKLTFADGRTKFVDYNTAAKIFQILEGNGLAVPKPERAKLKKIAEKVQKIDFKASSNQAEIRHL